MRPRGMRLGARQRFEDMHHEGGRNHRRDEIDKWQAEQRCDHDPPEEYAETKTVAHRSGRRGIEPSERDHLEILSPQKISVKGKEENQIYPGDQKVYGKRQKIEQKR